MATPSVGPAGDAVAGRSVPPARRVRVRVEGGVQGVGFRPYVYRLASSFGLAGFVRNDARGVVLELEGASAHVDGFLEALPHDPPPLAVIERVSSREVRPRGERGFAIHRSAAAAGGRTLLPPDAATCDACLAELFDPGDRRFRYPFLNCTDCGPRFTIVRSLPYDRPATTMAGFPLCDACLAEYEDPGNRRFHAQPNACPECGPRLRLADAPGRVLEEEGDALRGAVRAICAGAVVAVKGLGGWHLACRSDGGDAVARLRTAKGRPHKPFAVMARDLAQARELAALSPGDEALLRGRERPIVLVRRRPGAQVDEAVAPDRPDLGLMLPYTPLHHLLLEDTGVPLVMTSGNRTDEPIARGDDEAVERLASVADLFLGHDRPIHCRADDSVVRTVRTGGTGPSRPMVLRRSRGWVPLPLDLPVPATRTVLAVGGHLKNTFCLARGGRAWMGPHVGDLSDWDTLLAFREGIAHLASLFDLEPRVVAHDLHPDYLSTKEALARAAEAHVAVQHHHAHLAACLAEHGETGPALGAVFDGTGYGPDGTVWGGEMLLGGLRDFERLGHLLPVRMPGGEAAVREPWRMACAWLGTALEGERAPMPPGLLDAVSRKDWEAMAGIAGASAVSPVTTSVGRLFDGVAALCGLYPRTTFEGQAAMALEAAADEADGRTEPYPFSLSREGTLRVLDPRPAVAAVHRDVLAGVPIARVAAAFHDGLAEATARWCSLAADEAGIGTVVLSGGVWQNVRLLERTAERLRGEGLRVLVPELLPPNDGGLAFGQAAVAAAGERWTDREAP